MSELILFSSLFYWLIIKLSLRVRRLFAVFFSSAREKYLKKNQAVFSKKLDKEDNKIYNIYIPMKGDSKNAGNEGIHYRGRS